MDHKPHLKKAQEIWKAHLRFGDLAVDATVGNGYDTAFLKTLTDDVIAYDIQEKAIESSRKRVEAEFRLASHETFDLPRKARLFVYNLGYLPGGDHGLTTRVETTLKSLFSAIDHLSEDGLISITCYPGHEEGKKEEAALLALDLPCTYYRWRSGSPTLLLIAPFASAMR
jgi:hypothetical protein